MHEQINIQINKQVNIQIIKQIYAMGIARRGCSVGNGFGELASQRGSGDVGKESRRNHSVSFTERRMCFKPLETSQHACLFRGYLWANHRTSVLSKVPFPFYVSSV